MGVVKGDQFGQNEDRGQTPGGGGDNAPKAYDIGEMFSRMSSQSSWSGEALEYLDNIRKILEDPSRTAKIEMKYLNDDAVAFSLKGESVVLVRESDIVNLPALAADAKMQQAKESFYKHFPSNRLNNIVTVNRYMFNRSAQMASYITQTLVSRIDDAIKNFNIGSFNRRYRVVIDTEMSNVRQFFDAHSPSPVMCGDFGFIASLQDNTSQQIPGQHPSTTHMFAVTGYVEFILDERNNTFTPMVHVTDILSPLPSTKILALAFPLIGDIFIGRGLWRHPYTSIGKAEVNIGNLIIDPNTQKPLEVKTEFDMRKLFREYINEPILAFDTRAGHTTIPGLTKLTRTADHHLLATEINEFLMVDNSAPMGTVGQNVFREIVGVWEASKHSRFSNLMDTRDINYLNMVAKTKWSQQLEMLKTRYEVDPIKRWEFLCKLVGDLTPTHNSITTMIYGEFVQHIASVVANSIDVSVPSLTTVQSIDLSDIQQKAYHPGVPQFGPTGGSNMMGGGFMRF